VNDIEQRLRSALGAEAARHVAPSGAWARNRARLQRRTRARRIGYATLATAIAGVTAVAAAALPRTSTAPPAPPLTSASASPTPASHRLHAPDLHGMSAADARTLAEKCVAAYLGPVQELPDEKLLAPPESYELVYALPEARTRWNVGDVVALKGRDHVVMCSGTLTSPGMAHETIGRRPWLEYAVEGGVGQGGSDGYWEGSGRYSAEVARIEVTPVRGGAPVPVVMDNGVWFGTGTAEGPVTFTLRGRYPEVRGYAADGTLLYSSATLRHACFVLHGENVDYDGRPTTETGCVRTWPWP
jgi:hypothetical protein